MANSQSEYHYEFKVIIVGDNNVGKSSIFSRVVHNQFDNFPSKSFYHEKDSINVDINGQLVKLVIWDHDSFWKFQVRKWIVFR